MRRDADYKLSQDQIDDRNQMIGNIKVCLQNLNENYGLELPLNQLYSKLEPGLPGSLILSPPLIFDNSWLNKKRKLLHKDLIKYIGKHVLSKVQVMQQKGERLNGSSNAIAHKLCYSLIEKNQHYSSNRAVSFKFDNHTELLWLTFSEIISYVREEYESTYKTYRLWNEYALSFLIRYLFDSHDDYDHFADPAIWEELSYDEDPVSLNEFIRAVDQALYNLPTDDDHFTEFAYPDISGVDFTDYVPAANMTEAQKDQLYNIYLESMRV